MGSQFSHGDLRCGTVVIMTGANGARIASGDALPRITKLSAQVTISESISRSKPCFFQPGRKRRMQMLPGRGKIGAPWGVPFRSFFVRSARLGGSARICADLRYGQFRNALA